MKHMISIATLLFSVLSSVNASALTIEVFTHNPKSVAKVSGHHVIVHNLSAPDKLKNPTFSASAARAEKEALAWLQSSAGQRHINNLRAAHQGQVKAIKYGLKKTPAVVFENGKYAVYGTTNVRQALKDYHGRKQQK